MGCDLGRGQRISGVSVLAVAGIVLLSSGIVQGAISTPTAAPAPVHLGDLPVLDAQPAASPVLPVLSGQWQNLTANLTVRPPPALVPVDGG